MLPILGCGGEKTPPLAEVHGVVVDQDGTPLDGIKVTFLPDPEKAVFGGPASGETDASGKFVLLYKGNKDKPGTAVGINRVILSDIKSINSSRDDEPIARRFHRKYIAAKSTDLKFDVKDEDGQSFEIKVDWSDDDAPEGEDRGR